MKVTLYPDAARCLRDVGDYLERREAENNLALGILYAEKNKPSSAPEYAERLFASVKDDGDIQLVMVWTPPRELILAGDGPKREAAIRAVVPFLVRTEYAFTGVNGPPALSAAFAEEWGQVTGKKPAASMEQVLLTLGKINPVPMSTGRLRTATGHDAKLLTEWIADFYASSGLSGVSYQRAAAITQNAVEEASLYVWEDGEPVSMARKTRATRNGIVVTSVYTPPRFQNKGYATSCVAELSKRLLEEGYSFCSLFADKANPVSTGIYRKIGYQPVAETKVFYFSN